MFRNAMMGETPLRVGGVLAGGSRCAQPEDTPPCRTEFPSSVRAETEFRHEGEKLPGLGTGESL